MSDDPSPSAEPEEAPDVVPVDSDAGPVDPAPDRAETASDVTARLDPVSFEEGADAAGVGPAASAEAAEDGRGGGDPADSAKLRPSEGEGTPEGEGAPEGERSELQGAYDCLEIRTPLEELRAFASARIEALVRLGDAERAERTATALEVGLQALREVMGAVTRPREQP
ncbi:MAG: hypothetical protein D6731_06015 [Planctomycetota bacterium]|nr:MAG: hypothetical protein D6731_06015 [Planctomycetota bacterium]